MNLIKQTRQEMRLITKTRFLLVTAAVLLVFGCVYPLIGKYFSRVVYYDSNYNPASITIRGVTINDNSPVFYEFENLQKAVKLLETDSGSVTTDPKVKKTALDLTDESLAFCEKAASEIKDYNDYRSEAVFMYMRCAGKKKLLEADRSDLSVLRRALEIVVPDSYLSDEDFNAEYVNISASERREKLEDVNKRLEAINYILENKDAEDSFDKYIDLMTGQIQDLEKNIQKSLEALEKEIIAHPGSEEQNSRQIEDYKIDIERCRIQYELLNLRRERKINPYDSEDWRNNAIFDIEYNNNSIIYESKMVSEEEFVTDRWMVLEFKTYQNYERLMQEQINGYNNNILIAQNSLKADKPDMKYVDNGARAVSHTFLVSANLTYLFAVLLGGWLIANEHQSGTIRLLLIRPKTRTKILISKYLGALVFCFLLYTLSQLLCMLTAGAVSGFGDFLMPNYTVSGPEAFFPMYMSRFFICFLPVLFMLAFSFMLSVLLKNMALSIIIPYGSFTASMIVIEFMSQNIQGKDYLAFTPFRYLTFSSAFKGSSDIYSSRMTYYGISAGSMMNVSLGTVMLLLYSAAALAVSVIVFKKQDVQN